MYGTFISRLDDINFLGCIIKVASERASTRERQQQEHLAQTSTRYVPANLTCIGRRAGSVPSVPMHNGVLDVQMQQFRWFKTVNSEKTAWISEPSTYRSGLRCKLTRLPISQLTMTKLDPQFISHE
eukprot:4877765-Pleurochrysis_carterae.AAC.6